MRILKDPQTVMKISSLRHECESQKFLGSAADISSLRQRCKAQNITRQPQRFQIMKRT